MGRISKREGSRKDSLNSTQTTGAKRKLKLNKSSLLMDDDLFHPIKKAPRKARSAPAFSEAQSSTDSQNSKGPLEKNGEPKLASQSNEVTAPSFESHEFSAVFQRPAESGLFESPRKVARAPFCGIQPNYVSAYDKSPVTIPCSPSTALSRPLRRTISGICIRQLAETEISPQKRPFLSQGANENETEFMEEEESEGTEENLNAFEDETEKAAKALARKSTGNFVKINIRKKRFVPKSQQKSQFSRKRMNWKFRGAGRKF